MLSRLTSRRGLLKMAAGAVATGTALSSVPGFSFASLGNETAKRENAAVVPVEVLMREHGVLRRLILIYNECLRRLEAGKEIPNGVLGNAAEIARKFVEGYHHVFEEKELFPRFEKAGKYADLAKMLFVQHQAGRRLTISILDNSAPGVIASPEKKQKLMRNIHEFIRMYEPHTAREETVIYPSLRLIVPPQELDALWEKFSDKEQEFMARQGFEKIVDSVAKIEKQLSILELSQFTPPV